MALPIKDNPHTFGIPSILIHWLIALGIIGMYPLGLYIDTLTYYDPEYQTVPAWHKSIGMILLALLALRMVWRSMNRAPTPLPQPRGLQLATKAVHLLLYLLPLITLISGYMISTADGRPISVFNWFDVPALSAVIDNQEDLAGEVHYWVATLMIGLAGLHALAALKHHFINKDQTLIRMTSLYKEPHS
ncbi:cytochrome b [Amphritea sp. 1_MG-2023]|uniref:cytochrome b n=1 Tax=Amphritea sp. 1_MG-2023 TaxID=3062670 RepID=UPI0026E3966E|nr:cytochrome b [Amphritea sp. 1_MG-2023]MDO6563803.1 cytochrome b [Amphritea sp. 1_MG-2023]